MYQEAKRYLLDYSKQKVLSIKKNWSDEDVIAIMYKFLNNETNKRGELKNEVIKILEKYSGDGYNETVTVIPDHDFNNIASEVLKLTENNINTWIDIKDGQPTSGQKCWVFKKRKYVYLARYGHYGIFDSKPTFISLLGRGWKISNVEKWSPLIIPGI